MANYIINIGTGPSCNPDFAANEQFEADGLALLTVKDGAPKVEFICGMSTMDVANCIATGSSELQQAVCIADGLMKAREVAQKSNKDKLAKDFLRMLRQ